MIVLDTNVVSDMTSARPGDVVRNWLNGIPLARLTTTSINILELRYGIDLEKDAERRELLTARLDWFLGEFIGPRILILDTGAAVETAKLAARLKSEGRPIGSHDTLIAGICITHGTHLATRNVKHFAFTGVPLINPWAP